MTLERVLCKECDSKFFWDGKISCPKCKTPYQRKERISKQSEIIDINLNLDEI